MMGLWEAVKAGMSAAYDDDDVLYERALHDFYKPGTKVSIDVPVAKLLSAKYAPILCRASFGKMSVECTVSYGHFHRLRPVLDVSKETVNLLDYLSYLIPKKSGQIGLVTYQNGIQNTVDDFLKKARLILPHFPEGTLCIGLYNPMVDMVMSMNNIGSHLTYKDTPSTCRTRLFFSTLIAAISTIVPLPIWLHIAHSEGAAIAYTAIRALPIAELIKAKKHLITLTYGGVIPMPNEYPITAYNTYSDGDNAALRYGKPYVSNSSEYTIEIVKSQDPPSGSFPPGDHAFEGKTYQTALKNNIDDVKKFATQIR